MDYAIVIVIISCAVSSLVLMFAAREWLKISKEWREVSEELSRISKEHRKMSEEWGKIAEGWTELRERREQDENDHQQET